MLGTVVADGPVEPVLGPVDELGNIVVEGGGGPIKTGLYIKSFDLGVIRKEEKK